MKVMAGISLLPPGNLFGNDQDDEFSIVVAGKKKGVFKTFEYLSLPFSIAGKTDLFASLLMRATELNTDFAQELKRDPKAKEVVEQVFARMNSSPAFSGQVLELLLSKIYVQDEVLTRDLPLELNFASSLARVVFAWNQLADFYCIEGLVGGQGHDNPLMHNGRPHSLRAGTLDSLEGSWPSLFDQLQPGERNKVLLQLSSVVERDYHDLEQAVNVLRSIHGTHLLQPEEQEGLKRLEELARESFETNVDQGKFVNSLIRFHNWLPLGMKGTELRDKSVYDSICLPAKKAVELVPSEFQEKLNGIKDATSPKGVALVRMVQEGFLPGGLEVAAEMKELSSSVHQVSLGEGLRDFFTFGFEDHAFYTGLVGGKWKGLKLLHDTKKLFDLRYELAPGFCVSSVAVNHLFNKYGLLQEIQHHERDLNKEIVEEILREISVLNLSQEWAEVFSRAKELGNELMVRSSMYGEDGRVNFAGTYESVPCGIEGLDSAFKKVMGSFFSPGAIKAREESGLGHLPGISMVVQKRLSGRGGVLYLTDQEVSVSYARDGEEAVKVNGNYHVARCIFNLIDENSPLFPIRTDLETLQEVFGNIDLEFVCEEGTVYLNQMRAKYIPAQKYSLDRSQFEVRKITTIDELSSSKLDHPVLVRMDFLLSTPHINERREEVFNFIRHNRQYVVGIEGDMPAVAHLPNNIEGNFGIPYFMMEGK